MATKTLSSGKRPTVALGELGIQHKGEASQQEWERVTRQLNQVLSETGFAYLTQHGLPDDLVTEVLSAGTAFFQLEKETKMKWAPGEGFLGYVQNQDRYSDETDDMRESFVFLPEDYGKLHEEPPPIKTATNPLCDHLQTLNRRLLACFSLSLAKPRDYFAKMHEDMDTTTMYRFNYYPGSTKGRKDLTGFGAHTDFSTFTLLFSNSTGGLQVQDSAGQWVDLPVVPGTVLLLVGEFLTFYSNKRFKAPMHRVVLPSDEQMGRQPRSSLIVFTSADSHTPMWPSSDDPASNPPPSVKEFVEGKMRQALDEGKTY